VRFAFNHVLGHVDACEAAAARARAAQAAAAEYHRGTATTATNATTATTATTTLTGSSTSTSLTAETFSDDGSDSSGKSGFDKTGSDAGSAGVDRGHPSGPSTGPRHTHHHHHQHHNQQQQQQQHQQQHQIQNGVAAGSSIFGPGMGQPTWGVPSHRSVAGSARYVGPGRARGAFAGEAAFRAPRTGGYVAFGSSSHPHQVAEVETPQVVLAIDASGPDRPSADRVILPDSFLHKSGSLIHGTLGQVPDYIFPNDGSVAPGLKHGHGGQHGHGRSTHAPRASLPTATGSLVPLAPPPPPRTSARHSIVAGPKAVRQAGLTGRSSKLMSPRYTAPSGTKLRQNSHRGGSVAAHAAAAVAPIVRGKTPTFKNATLESATVRGPDAVAPFLPEISDTSNTTGQGWVAGAPLTRQRDVSSRPPPQSGQQPGHQQPGHQQQQPGLGDGEAARGSSFDLGLHTGTGSSKRLVQQSTSARAPVTSTLKTTEIGAGL
jgi:hypothetical protein